jgi:hypothetical protein
VPIAVSEVVTQVLAASPVEVQVRTDLSTWEKVAVFFAIEEPDDDWPPEGGDRVTATVTYSDSRGAATYRLSRWCDLWPSGTPGVVSFRELSEPTETRVAP